MMKSLILKVTVHLASHKYPLDTGELFMFAKNMILSCNFGNIGRSKSPSVVDMIICPLGDFSMIAFAIWQNCSSKQLLS